MNKLILCLFFSLVTSIAFSQKIYFVYLQTESEQPFFVKLNEKVYSSTASGYLIIPKLRDSTYNINIGFPDNKWPNQIFSIIVNHKDRGFLLKNFGEKGWGLFDLQNLSVQMAVGGKAAIENTQQPDNTEVSEFTEILSKAAGDPSLKEKPVRPKLEEKQIVAVVTEPVKKEEPVIKEPVVTKPAENAETVSVQKEEMKTEPVTTKPVEVTGAVVVNKEEGKEQPAEPAAIKKETEPAYKRSEVIKEAESPVAEGQDLVFIDNYDGKKDTIRILIPNPKPLVDPVKTQPKEEIKFLEINNDAPKREENIKPAEKTEEPVKEEKPVVKVPDPVKEEPVVKIPDMVKEESVKQTVLEPAKTEGAKKVIAEPVKQPVINNCTASAGESDFLKLRRKMAAADNDDDMITEARKYFKTTCFTVYQIRNLSALFLNDEGKYKFFDAAYNHASDAHNFISLQLELKEGYYINRFKAMLK